MLQAFLATGADRYSEQQTRKAAPNPLWNRYAASDKWLFLCVENDDASWSQLCETLGDPHLFQDPRFATAEGRRQHAAELIAALDAVIATDTADGWMERWRPLGIAASPIQNMDEVSRDPQAWENDYFGKVYSDEAQREVTVRGLPITLGKTPAAVESLGPELGQHTELILADTLGLSWDRIAELKAQGVIP
jgi:crotonobetainyl-CoA:carnitine CoA-transferase CaiB-like acyl-CoA transferase